MRKYNIINNTLGWMVFAIAAITYLLTIEPTASFWDCPEFISQGYKLEIGHPPGNPIFMLAARFAINFTNSPEMASVAVNSMSAILSALTILLLFWTITHLVKKLVVKDGEEDKMSLTQYLLVMGSGLCGALVYTWSDTFWFSAVEAEVYAFSSFCTALVFWLILKWEDHADEENSDRWLILIAYVIGVSIAVHLLNLLCIPAIVLVFYYKKFDNTTVKGSLISLALSFVIIALILFGLVPGFVKVAQWFEVLCVNSFGMPFHSGVLIYTVLDFAVFIWCLVELYRQRSAKAIKISFMLSVFFSGMLFIGKGWFLPLLLVGALAVYLFAFCNRVPVRIFSVIITSLMVIFIGYSSYALILIRSTAQPPMDQNSPDNVFSLASYLNREQYGDTPLLYGATFGATYVRDLSGSPITEGQYTTYAKQKKQTPDEADAYKAIESDGKYITTPELNMLFPRMHDSRHAAAYKQWIGLEGVMVDGTVQVDGDGNSIATQPMLKPTFLENLQFFLDYQLNYMYWRYFMWNFAGRQNDIQGSGEITHGNWISGIPFIDNIRLGNQSLLPDDLGKNNKGHNVFYLLPLLLGIIGLLWQAYAGKRGIEQFWVVFFLFFMTGIAIVLYLNQTPNQPRERDYAYAGSFYAFAIWVGMGVAGLYYLIMQSLKSAKKEAKDGSKTELYVAAAATVVGILVPLQMVSQTWDDHDRSGRYPARDFGMNYLSSVDENGIIFTNGDNDTFPLWYCQEVEGYRTDVRVVNLSYLTADWYIDQMRRPSYNSKPLPMQATEHTFAYDFLQVAYYTDTIGTPVNAKDALARVYAQAPYLNGSNYARMDYTNLFIPVDAEAAVKAKVVPEKYRDYVSPAIHIDLQNDPYNQVGGAICSSLMALDFLSSSVENGWDRPIYFASTVPRSYFLGLTPYLMSTGMAYQITPLVVNDPKGDVRANTEKMYNNVMTKFRWAGLDKAKPGELYLDETILRMVSSTRTALLGLAEDLAAEQDFDKARKVLDLMEEKMPTSVAPYANSMGMMVGNAYNSIGQATENKADIKKAQELIEAEVKHFCQYVRFFQALTPSEYNRLSREDRDVYQQFMPLSIYYYLLADGNLDHILKVLEDGGVNHDNVNRFMQQVKQLLSDDDEEASEGEAVTEG